MSILAMVFAFIGGLGINLVLLSRIYRAGLRDGEKPGVRVGEGIFRSSGERVCPSCGHVIEQERP